MKNTKSKVSFSAAIICIAVALAVTICTSFVTFKITSDKSAQTALDTSAHKAVSSVDSFTTDLSRNTFLFADKLFSKANVVASSVTDVDSADETLEKLARNLYLDSIMITDENGTCIAAYPSNKKGTKISDNTDTAQFAKVLKGMSFKSQSEPVPVKGSDNEYSVYAAVGRANMEAGIVIIGATVDDYDKISGESIAKDCADNTAIAKDGKIVSSSFDESNATTLEELGVKDENINNGNFTITTNGTSYICKAVTSGDYTVVSAVSQNSVNSSAIPALGASVIAAILMLILMYIFFSFKSKK